MKIEDIEELEESWKNAGSSDDVCSLLEQAIEALRLEAWHPIEEAEELGAKDGREVLVSGKYSPLNPRELFMVWFVNDTWLSSEGNICEVTHFRFINLP
jgi:hypothetical protein